MNTLKFKNYTVTAKPLNGGFSQHIVVNTISNDKALELGRKELSDAYGSEIAKEFTLSIKTN